MPRLWEFTISLIKAKEERKMEQEQKCVMLFEIAAEGVKGWKITLASREKERIDSISMLQARHWVPQLMTKGNTAIAESE